MILPLFLKKTTSLIAINVLAFLYRYLAKSKIALLRINRMWKWAPVVSGVSLVIIIIFFVSSHLSTRKDWGNDKIPIDIRACMSILSKKGNHLTDYEKSYLIQMGHGDIQDTKIDSQIIIKAFLEEIDNTSEAKKNYEEGQALFYLERRNRSR